MATSTLPISLIADVIIQTTSPQTLAPSFNTGLVVGPTSAIPSYGANSRIRKYLATTFSSAMLTDGFMTSSPEYICAQIYFSQSPQPQAIFIGRQDLTALQTITIDVPGTGWAVGDKFTITQAGASYGVGTIVTETAGVPNSIAVVFGSQGTAYSIAAGLVATAVGPSTGINLTINVTVIGETALQAVQYCRLANAIWYPCMVTDATDADHTAISAWVLSQVGTIYFGNSADSAVLNGLANNLFSTLFANSSKRTWMQWATTQSGLVPNQIYFTAAVMGQAMASNTQLANSSFTEKFSGGVPLVGVVVEPNLSTTQIANIEGSTPSQGPNGNLFLNYGGSFNVLEQGTMMAAGVFFDQILNLDILASNIQYAIMNLLTTVPKVPQTDGGQQLLIQAVETALAQSALTGFIAPGTWNGQNILSLLTTGTPLPTGYFVGSQSYSVWGKANPSLVAARQAPPIYVALIEAGAVHFVTIAVQVQI
jgi:hypothetical protein